jgi:hypothetical protein
MSHGSGVSRGDRNRNARLSRLLGAVPVTHAIVGIDLAERKQMLVVTDHDSKVLARRTFRCKAWDLGSALDWASDRARGKGFAGVTVACEPTGHRWMVLAQLTAERGMPFVCVQPAASSWARKSEDLTTDKTDDKDAVLIARLTGQLRCYLPEPVDESNATWTRLRHLGTRREELLEEHVAAVQTIRDLLECVWPAALEVAAQPFKSATWVAAITVVVGQGRGRDGGDLDRTRRLGAARFERTVRAEVVRRGGVRPCLRIVRRLFAALGDQAGVVAHRPAVFERLEWTLADWDEDRAAGRGRGDPRADRGPDPVHLRPRRRQARRPRTEGTQVRHVHRPSPGDRRRPSAAAGRRVAGGVGVPADQPGVRRALPTPHQPRTPPADPDPSPDRRRRSDPAAAVRRHQPAASLGPRHRRPRHHGVEGAHEHHCGITRFSN